MRYPVPNSLPTPNAILIFDGTSGARGGTIDNTGAVDVYLANTATKPDMQSDVDDGSGIPSVGKKLSPGQTFQISSCAGQIFAIAAGNGGEVEVLDYPVDLPCC